MVAEGLPQPVSYKRRGRSGPRRRSLPGRQRRQYRGALSLRPRRPDDVRGRRSERRCRWTTKLAEDSPPMTEWIAREQREVEVYAGSLHGRIGLQRGVKVRPDGPGHDHVRGAKSRARRGVARPAGVAVAAERQRTVGIAVLRGVEVPWRDPDGGR